MFDLNKIEEDWKTNSFSLNEEEILEIYRSEEITLKSYRDEIDQYKKQMDIDISTEERLLANVFGTPEIVEKIEYEDKLKTEHKFPSKKRLSNKSQGIIVEGCLYIVFYETRKWFDFFKGKISIESIYYICLETLINTVKYTLHPEKPVFLYYVSRNIVRSIIKYIAHLEHITYNQAYRIIYNLENDNYDEKNYKYCQLSFDYEKENPEKPSKIFYRLKNEFYDIDYIRSISSDEFMRDYRQSIDNLDELSRTVMQFSFDIDGNRGCTSKEIGDYLGIDPKRVDRIRRNAIRTLRNDSKVNNYNI